MTQQSLQDALVADIQALFEHTGLNNSLGAEREISVYAQDAPIRGGDDEGMDTAAPPEPFIIVRLVSGALQEDATEQLVDVVLIICVCDQAEDRQGYRDALHLANELMRHYGSCPTLANRYLVRLPLKWATQDEDTHPFYYVGISFQVETPHIFYQEVPET